PRRHLWRPSRGVGSGARATAGEDPVDAGRDEAPADDPGKQHERGDEEERPREAATRGHPEDHAAADGEEPDGHPRADRCGGRLPGDRDEPPERGADGKWPDDTQEVGDDLATVGGDARGGETDDDHRVEERSEGPREAAHDPNVPSARGRPRRPLATTDPRSAVFAGAVCRGPVRVAWRYARRAPAPRPSRRSPQPPETALRADPRIRSERSGPRDGTRGGRARELRGARRLAPHLLAVAAGPGVGRA